MLELILPETQNPYITLFVFTVMGLKIALNMFYNYIKEHVEYLKPEQKWGILYNSPFGLIAIFVQILVIYSYMISIDAVIIMLVLSTIILYRGWGKGIRKPLLQLWLPTGYVS